MVYVNAAEWEGWDMPIVEANAMGIPSIVFDCAAHKESLKYGILIKTSKDKKKNTKKFAECMKLMGMIHLLIKKIPKGCEFVMKENIINSRISNKKNKGDKQ